MNVFEDGIEDRNCPSSVWVRFVIAKGPAGPNWTSQRTSWSKLDQPKNQLVKIGPAKGPVPFCWFQLDQPQDQAKDQLVKIGSVVWSTGEIWTNQRSSQFIGYHNLLRSKILFDSDFFLPLNFFDPKFTRNKIFGLEKFLDSKCVLPKIILYQHFLTINDFYLLFFRLLKPWGTKKSCGFGGAWKKWKTVKFLKVREDTNVSFVKTRWVDVFIGWKSIWKNEWKNKMILIETP